jgi:hypothetical protein
LGISPGATKQEIKKAFRKKALQLHPDRNSAPDAKEQFQRALEAYEILYDGKAQYKRVKPPRPQKPRYANPQGKTERDKYERPYTSKERVKAKTEARRRHADKMAKEFRQQEIRYDNFKKTITYKVVMCYAALSFVLGFFLFLDQILPNKIESVPVDNLRVETFKIQGGGTFKTYFAQVCYQEIEIGPYQYQYLQLNPNAWVEYSALLEEVKDIQVKEGAEKIEDKEIDGIVLIPYMLMLTLFVFLSEGPNYGYFKAMELTTFVSVLGLVVFLVFSDGFYRLLGFYGC